MGEEPKLINTRIDFYLSNSSELANIYVHPNVGPDMTTEEANIKTDKNGYFQFFVGDGVELSGGYSNDTLFKLVYDSGTEIVTINQIDIFPAVMAVDEKDNTSQEKDYKNKLVSNALAYKFSQHGLKNYDSAPHGLEPVNHLDTNTDYNKLVSNWLLNTMFSQITSGGTESEATTAYATIRNFEVSSMLPSGDLFYVTVNHYIGRRYPVVYVRDKFDKQLIRPNLILTESKDSLKIFCVENIGLEISVIG